LTTKVEKIVAWEKTIFKTVANGKGKKNVCKKIIALAYPNLTAM
jgi:hypothetical protein